jgi:hypothetical protein
MFNRFKRTLAQSDCFGLAVVATLVLFFCRGLLLTEDVPFFRDLITYFYPLRFALHESYMAGKLPLWNRQMAMGFPLLADFQSGAFYPPHLFLAVLPFFTAIRALFVAHFLIAGFGAYLVFRRWRYPVYLAISGAVLFTIGGTTVALTNLLNHFQTAVWLPWMVLTWERLLEAPCWKRFVASGSISATALLAGSPEIFALCISLMFLDGVRIKASVATLSWLQFVLLFLGHVLFLAGLVMIQALPTAELVLESRRQQPIPLQEALYWSLKPVNLLNLFFIDKVIDADAAVGMRFFFIRETPFLVSYYLGAFSLLGIALWFCFSSRWEKTLVLTVISVSLLCAFGSYTPIYPFLYRAWPLLGAVRYPEKFFFFTFVILIYMAMRGAKGFLHDGGEAEKKAYAVMALVCGTWLGLYLYVRFDTLSFVRLVSDVAGAQLASGTTAVADILANLERQLALSLGLVLLCVLFTTKAVRRELVGVLLVLTVFVDLAWANKDLLFLLNPDFVRRSPRILDPAAKDTSRLFYAPSGRNLHPSSVSIAGRPTFKDATALSLQNLLPNTGILDGFDYMQEIDALGRDRYAQFLSFANKLDFVGQLRLLRLFNVGYLISFRELSASGIHFAGRFPQYYSWLYKVDGAVPRAYIVNKATAVANADAVLPLLSDTKFDSAQEVILEAGDPLEPQRPLQATAKIAHYEDSRVSIAVTSNDDAVLILADSYYPGWRAYVDGSETEILRANYFFRGVRVRPGDHFVEFKYEPQSFTLGLIISLLTFLGTAVASALRLWNRPSMANRRAGATTLTSQPTYDQRG